MAPGSWRANTQPGTAVDARWWSTFGDPALSAAVEAALARNTDLAIAEARVREAEALATQARSGLRPSLNASLPAQDARTLSAFGQPSESASVQPQLEVAYEVDLWGKLRSADVAARASLQASRYDRDAAALSVAAATARAYVTLASLDSQLMVARETLAAREGALQLARRRAETGDTSQLELSQAQAEYRDAAQRIPSLELSTRRQENALRLLAGDVPGDVPRGSLDALALPMPDAGLPSVLLARRPDIAQAEAQLTAADASLASARAALLPQVRLTGSIGRLFVEHVDPLTVWSLGGSILAPLFDGGRLRGEANASGARRDQTAFSYRGTVLNAFSEVENALEGMVRLQAQREEVEAQRTAVTESLRHARNRYRAGYASYLEELDAQRSLLNIELALVQLRENQFNNAISLYQALGGGWSAIQDNPDSSSTQNKGRKS